MKLERASKGLVVAILSVAVGATACSENEGDGRSSAPSDEESSAAGAANGQPPAGLTESLLAVDDMGEGWTEQSLSDGGEDADLCVYVDDETLSVGDLEWANRVLTSPGAGGGTLVFESLTVVPEGKGPEAFEALRQQVSSCDERERDGYTETYRQLDLEELGDESLGVSAGTIVGGVETPLHSDIVYVRLGDAVMSLSVTQTDAGGIEMWAPPAIDKVEARLTTDSSG
jgi:hypothetical protein